MSIILELRSEGRGRRTFHCRRIESCEVVHGKQGCVVTGLTRETFIINMEIMSAGVVAVILRCAESVTCGALVSTVIVPVSQLGVV